MVLCRQTCLAFTLRLWGHPKSLRALSHVHRPMGLTTRLFASSFNPPDPPASQGDAVYPDIDFSYAGNEASQGHRRNHDEAAVFVINGASRGIGLQMAKSLVERTNGMVVACCRDPTSATALNDFVDSNPDRIQTLALDMEVQDSIESASAQIGASFGRVDLLLNTAGILGDGVDTPGPERSIAKLDRDWVEKTLAVNVVGPVMLSKELAPLMRSKSRGRAKPGDVVRPVSVVASLSARVGSISDNELGGWYSYRFSKSALNQATRTMSHELKRQGTWAVSLHPGTTDTDLSKPFQKNVQEGRLFPVEFTAERLLNVVDSMQEEHSGGLYDWAGKALPF